MTRFIILLGLCLLTPTREAGAKFVRAEILFLYDTSGSMASAGDPWGGSQCTDCGSDCLGDRLGDVDICGDGMCTGWEKVGSCSDCTLQYNNSPSSGGVSPAGQAPECGLKSRSFLAMSKQVLRSLLPAIRQTARMGLITQNQSGYYRYFEAASGASKKVSVYLSEWEMLNLGAWDSVIFKPKASFVWPGTQTTFHVTSAASGLSVAKDALYRRDDKLETEKRFAYAGKKLTSGGYTWSYLGSYFTYLQPPIKTASVKIETSYKGPIYKDSAGKTWVYGRWRFADCSSSQQGFTASCSGPPLFLVKLNPSTNQNSQDATLGKILAHANSAPNGGMFANGPTPMGPAMTAAKQHFLDRRDGKGDFAAAGVDWWSTCRKRLVIFITDTTLSCTNSTEAMLATQAQILYNADPANRIKTYVIALPGGDVTLVDDIAKKGGTTAIKVTDHASLINQVKKILDAATGGDVITDNCPAPPCLKGKCAPGYVCTGGICVALTPDAGAPDAGTPDAGTPDAGAPDTSTALSDGPLVDASLLPDASPVDAALDAGPPDAPLLDGAATDAAADAVTTPDFSMDAAPDSARGDSVDVDAMSADAGPVHDSSGTLDISAGSDSGQGSDSGGCDCNVAGEPPVSAMLLLGLLALMRMNRRRG